VRAAAWGAVAVLLLAGCSTAPDDASTGPDDGRDNGPSGRVTVFAAASLTGSFGVIADAFTAEHPDVDVVLSFGGSSALASQIVQAAPADVFAAANPSTMQAVVEAGLTDGEPVTFASNVLAIAVAAGNPGGITDLRDFADPDATIALCAVEVPCGSASAELLADAGVVASVDSYEQDVRAVLTKVELGEVDAGLVYATDVLDAGSGVEGIAVDSAPVEYPIAALSASEHPAAAAAFVAFVLSDVGQAILREAGFGAP